jgi:hypothetical protein
MIIIDPTHNGPPDSGHGGVAAGRFAELINPSRASVRFRTFIPLGVPLVGRVVDDGSATVADGDTVVATVRPMDPLGPVADMPVPSIADVNEAEASWLTAHAASHPFPTCFGCGPARPTGDGLQLRPGRLSGRDMHATTWQPDLSGDAPAWLVWAALDCGSAGPVLATAPRGAVVVTGELAVDIAHPVPGKATLLVISRAISHDESKTRVAAAIVDPATGQQLAAATSTWFTIAGEVTT